LHYKREEKGYKREEKKSKREEKDYQTKEEDYNVTRLLPGLVVTLQTTEQR
jgi:hypothetical protein